MTIAFKDGFSTSITLSNTQNIPAPPASGSQIYSNSSNLYFQDSEGTPGQLYISGYPLVFSQTGTNIGIWSSAINFVGGASNLVIGNATALNGAVDNIIIGASSGTHAKSLSESLILGTGAAGSIESGNGNTFLGSSTAFTITSSDNCTFVGFASSTSIATGLTNATAIGSSCLVNSSNSVNIGHACNVGINNPTPAYSVDIVAISGACAIALDTGSLPTTPASGRAALYYDGTNFKYVNSAGTVKTITAT